MLFSLCSLSQVLLLPGFWMAPAAPTTAPAAPTPRREASPWIDVRPLSRQAQPYPTRVAPRATQAPPLRAGTTTPTAHPTTPRSSTPYGNNPTPRALRVVERAATGLPSGGGRLLTKERMLRLMSFYLQRAQTNKRSGIMLTREREGRARSLADMIIAPCCYTQPASIHGNAVAAAVKASLRWLVNNNYTDDEIKQAFVRAYHPRILSVPATQSIYVIPMVAALLALLFVCIVIFRWYKRGAADGAEAIELDGDFDGELTDSLDATPKE